MPDMRGLLGLLGVAATDYTDEVAKARRGQALPNATILDCCPGSFEVPLRGSSWWISCHRPHHSF